jgi:hypothetical protein
VGEPVTLVARAVALGLPAFTLSAWPCAAPGAVALVDLAAPPGALPGPAGRVLEVVAVHTDGDQLTVELRGRGGGCVVVVVGVTGEVTLVDAAGRPAAAWGGAGAPPLRLTVVAATPAATPGPARYLDRPVGRHRTEKHRHSALTITGDPATERW